MILDAAWAPCGGKVFATAGRDKQVKVWAREEANAGGYTCKATIAEEHPVTALDFMNVCVTDGRTYLAVGTEVGRVRIYCLAVNEAFSVRELVAEYPRSVYFSAFENVLLTLLFSSSYPYPSKAITQLAWKPQSGEKPERVEMELAIASEDSSLRVYSLSLPSAAGSE